MSTEPKLITAILVTQDLDTFHKIKDSDLRTKDGKDSYKFLLEYINQYKSFPSVDIFKTKFPDFPYQLKYDNASFFYSEFLEYNSKLDLTLLFQETSALLNSEALSYDIATKIQEKLNTLQTTPKDNQVFNIGDTIDRRFDAVIEKCSNEEKDNTFTFGHPELDKAGPGFMPGDIGIILARLGVGKTWYALYLCYLYWKQGLRPMFISLEMTEQDVGKRFDAVASGISFAGMVKGTLSKEEIDDFIKYKDDLKTQPNKFFITAPTRSDVPKIHQLIKEYRPSIVFIDYIQMVKPSTSKAVKEKRFMLEEIIYDSKEIAKKEQIPIVYLAQANREGREAMPTPDNIKEADAIGAGADVVLSLFATDEEKKNNHMGFQITKYRNGATWAKALVPWDFSVMNVFSLKVPFPAISV